ncbi:hypothetical protein FCE95_03015 [Luteimonas gilva]|uniref:Uncharacterized protein n=1 Tax=Luteimonas gilva TaxID=2572684 RepID=A0A4U5JTY2_9GAMM|nr:hypothetical protein [Luteimonas gilva]TKR33294.1 hypothetical protein FCE95_03015 [Luteimonas gilva]
MSTLSLLSLRRFTTTLAISSSDTLRVFADNVLSPPEQPPSGDVQAAAPFPVADQREYAAQGRQHAYAESDRHQPGRAFAAAFVAIAGGVYRGARVEEHQADNKKRIDAEIPPCRHGVFELLHTYDVLHAIVL